MTDTLKQLLKSLAITNQTMQAEVGTTDKARWAQLTEKQANIFTSLIIYANLHHSTKSA